MFNKLRQSLDPEKCLDPLKFLPFELAEMVMDSLEMRDRVYVHSMSESRGSVAYFVRVCLVVSKSWKSQLEASPRLWTTFDTRTSRRPVGLHSLKMHLRRSNYALDKAIISWRAKFDGAKMAYLTRTCKQLRHLEMDGSGGVIGDSLNNALPLAQNLRTLIISRTCHIPPRAMLLALRICQKTLVKAEFVVSDGKIGDGDLWPRLESMESFVIRVAHCSQHLDAVCNVPLPYQGDE
jgi:F-box/TPR repeat protein Pof3